MHLIFDARHIIHEHSGLGRYTGALAVAMIQKSELCRPLSLILEDRSYAGNELYRNIVRAVNSTSGVDVVRMNAPLFGIRHHLEISRFLFGCGNVVYFYPYFDLPLFVPQMRGLVIHDMFIKIIPDYIVSHRRLKKCYYEFLLWWHTTMDATRVITVSQSSANDITRLVPYVRTTPVWAHLGRYARRDSTGSKILDKISGKYILYVGDRRPHKNVQKMVRLYGRVRELGYAGSFIIAGNTKDFGWSFDEYVRAYPGVKHIGRVDDDDLDVLYNNADALLFLSRYEGFGLPIVEAACCGTRVICGNNSSQREIAPSWALMLEADVDEEDGAEAIYEYLRSNIRPDVAAYERRFTWDTAAARIWGYLESEWTASLRRCII